MTKSFKDRQCPQCKSPLEHDEFMNMWYCLECTYEEKDRHTKPKHKPRREKGTLE